MKVHMKTLWLSGLIAFSPTVITKPTLSQGIPVIDAAGYAQGIVDQIEQVTHQMVLLQQFQQMISEYETMLRNALSLADFEALLDLRGVLHDIMYSDVGQTIFSTVYGLDPSSFNYANEVISILRDDYNLPTNNGELMDSVSGHLDVKDLERFGEYAKTVERDVSTLGASHKALSLNREKSEDYKQSILDMYQSILDVPSESLQVAVQTNGTAQVLNASINQTALEMQHLKVELELLREQQRLESEENSIKQQVAMLEAQSRKRRAPYSNLNSWELK